jgi:hypothetical protein
VSEVQTAVPRPPSTEKLVHERVGLKSPAILLPGRLGALFSRRRRIFLAWTTSAKVRVRSGASALSVGARQMRYTYGRTPYLWSSDDGWRSRDEQECWGIAARHLPESTPRRCRLGVLPAMVPVFHPVCAIPSCDASGVHDSGRTSNPPVCKAGRSAGEQAASGFAESVSLSVSSGI